METKRKDLLTWFFDEGHTYSLFQSSGVLGGSLIGLSHKDLEYYIAADKKLDKEQLNELMQYLRWDFDSFEEVYKEVEKEVEEKSAKGNKVTKKVKEKVLVGIENKCAPTTENMKKKKVEILSSLQNPEDYKNLFSKILPRIVDHEIISNRMKSKDLTNLHNLAERIARTA